MTEEQTAAVLEFDDIQGPVLRNRPLPYLGLSPAAYRQPYARPGDAGRLAPRVATAANWHNPPIMSGST